MLLSADPRFSQRISLSLSLSACVRAHRTGTSPQSRVFSALTRKTVGRKPLSPSLPQPPPDPDPDPDRRCIALSSLAFVLSRALSARVRAAPHAPLGLCLHSSPQAESRRVKEEEGGFREGGHSASSSRRPLGALE
jgi:hypothetical protein